MYALKERTRYYQRAQEKEKDEEMNKYLRRNLRKQVGKQIVQYSEDLCAMILWTLAEYTESKGKPWGKKKLLEFGRAMQPNFAQLVDHYQMDEEDMTYLCEKMLLENKGITEKEITGLLKVGAEVRVKEKNGEVHSA